MRDGERGRREIGGEVARERGLAWLDGVAHAAIRQLPPVRDDEPRSLRQDILDELRDHLACAFRSELIRTNGDTARAERNVRDRFGDPARIARRLWFDAMKGQLMTQKILIGTCIVLVVASVGFYALVWQSFAREQERNAKLAEQSQAASAQLLAEAQKTNAALLARVEELAKSNAISDPQWNQVTLRLMSPKEHPAPIAHTLKPVRVEAAKQGGEKWEFSPDKDGVVDCGLMQPGKYYVYLETTWQERNGREITVLPGRSLDVTITCPAAIPRTVPVEWTIDWPENLGSYDKKDASWLLVIIDGRLRRQFGEDTWRMDDGGRLLAFHPDGRMINLSAIEPPTDSAISAQLSEIESARDFLQSRRHAMPIVGSKQVWVGADYRIRAMAYAEWDDAEEPLLMLQDNYQPRILFGGPSSGIFDHEFDVRHEGQRFTAAREAGRWTIDVPPGLIEWAKLRRERQIEYPKQTWNAVDQKVLKSLFRPPVEPKRSDNAPIEAPRPSPKR